MRIKRNKECISYDDTLNFFKRRIQKFNNSNPYSITMYQDHDPKLVKERNEKEIHKLLPKLQLNHESRILDVACGIGRWSDSITDSIDEYCGVDFCEEFIDLAKQRNIDRQNRHFYVSAVSRIAEILNQHNERPFNRVLCVGCFMYLNDDDVISTLNSIESISENRVIFCIREPIGLGERLTLKRQFSEELNDDYNAIYRTREEFLTLLRETVVQRGFVIVEEARLFEQDNLNNRKETTQYYFILKRGL